MSVSRWQLSLPVGYAPGGRRFVTLREFAKGATLAARGSLSARHWRDLTIARIAALPRYRVSTGTSSLNRASAIRELLEGGRASRILIKIERGCVDELLRRIKLLRRSKTEG